MAKHWKAGKSGEVGITIDEDKKSITLFAGKSAIHLNSEDEQVVIQGKMNELHGGDRTEDMLLKRTTGIEAAIPSTMVTPVPQLSLSLPFNKVKGFANDIYTMMRMLI